MTGFMLATTLVSALLVGVACSFGDGGTFSPPVPSAPEPATLAVISADQPAGDRGTVPLRSAAAHPSSLRTGIPAIDTLVSAVATHDATALASMFVLPRDACWERSPQPTFERCPDDAAPGEPAQQFMYGDCRFATTRAAEPLHLARSLTEGSSLYAAFGLVDVVTLSGGQLSGYAVVFERPGQAWVAHVTAMGGVVSVDFGCESESAAAFISNLPAEKVLLPPPDGMPSLQDAG